MPRMFTTTALAALAMSGAAFAQPPVADPDAPHVAVSYADLNLNSMSGRSELARRIAAAADGLCGPAPQLRELAATQVYRACVRETIASSAPSAERAALLQARAHQQLAEAPSR